MLDFFLKFSVSLSNSCLRVYKFIDTAVEHARGDTDGDGDVDEDDDDKDRNENAATRAEPGAGDADTVPAMPGNDKAAGNVTTHRKGGKSKHSSD